MHEGEAEDRVVAGSNPALGTFKLILSLFQQIRLRLSISFLHAAETVTKLSEYRQKGRLIG